MKHTWHKEIKAWADGAAIEYKVTDNVWKEVKEFSPSWYEHFQYRIKPQPKEPQYLYVYQMGTKVELAPIKRDTLRFICGDREMTFSYSGKIKLEQDDDTE